MPRATLRSLAFVLVLAVAATLPRLARGFTCGNGILEPGEQCDDGNTVSGDGCSGSCQIEGCSVSGIGSGSVPPYLDVRVWLREDSQQSISGSIVNEGNLGGNGIVSLVGMRTGNQVALSEPQFVCPFSLFCFGSGTESGCS